MNTIIRTPTGFIKTVNGREIIETQDVDQAIHFPTERAARTWANDCLMSGPRSKVEYVGQTWAKENLGKVTMEWTGLQGSAYRRLLGTMPYMGGSGISYDLTPEAIVKTLTIMQETLKHVAKRDEEDRKELDQYRSMVRGFGALLRKADELNGPTLEDAELKAASQASEGGDR